MELYQAASQLQSFLLEHYPQGGLVSICMRDFYSRQEHAAASTLIRKRKLKKVCNDFPHLLKYRDQSVYANRKERGEARIQRVAAAALKFYNDHLKGNTTLLRACEDRNILAQELTTWKDLEQQRGRKYISCSPSSVISHLERTHKKLFAHKSGDEKYLVWTELEQGNRTKEDLAREVIQRVRDYRKELESNRNGVEIDQINFGVGTDEVAPLKQPLLQQVAIRNQSANPIQVTINDAIAGKRNVIVDGPKMITISSGSKALVPTRFTPTSVTILKTLITFDVVSFGMESFSIARYVSVRSGNPEDYEILKPRSPYKKKEVIEKGGFNNRIALDPAESMPPGSSSTTGGSFMVKLKGYGIPQHWRDTLNKKDDVEEVINALYEVQSTLPSNDSDVTPIQYHKNFLPKNYHLIFHRLLWTEEAQMEIDIKNYDMINDKSMTRAGRYWSLHVPGLAESRPSVLKGDKIFVRFNGNTSQCFEGVVDRVEQENALILFPGSFASRYVKGVGVDVRFTFKRMNLRTSHQALDQSITGNILMSSFRGMGLSLSPPRVSIALRRNLVWFNRDLNQEQRAAVTGVLASEARPSPYLIYGPPGTGKTVTLVESIVQTLKLCGPSTKALVCAPSNAAADLLCERLAPYLSVGEMSRIIAYSREKSSVPDVVLKYACYSRSEDAFVTPPVDELQEKKVVIMTISTSGKNINIGLKDHFTHVFVDEAGHATEPEVVGCFGAAVRSSPVIVLAGDPKQLGPIIRSEKAKGLGLEMSLLERLSKCGPYERQQDGTYDGRVCTKLVRNYRSHPSILRVPNEMFYDNDLIPSGDVFRTHAYQSWEHLPKKGFPIIFHGVEGEDRREGNSPSWFNSEEASVVKEYVELLVKGTRTNRCQPEEIGIVSPYHKQVQKIRQLMKAKSYDTKVGSVDEFQGSERRVIIISTVRSSVEHVDFDRKHRLGFVANEKRFNVAITRAQALLIVIGNPFVLQNDKNWYELIKLCKENGGYTGCSFELGKKEDIDFEMDQALKGIASMEMKDNDEKSNGDDDDDSFVEVEDPISAMTAMEQPEWRVEE